MKRKQKKKELRMRLTSSEGTEGLEIISTTMDPGETKEIHELWAEMSFEADRTADIIDWGDNVR